jgi:BirA family transcriptional regulator, biotin operon repressor / biotin---[acetyl-CoA-carboxylase] ligase
MARIFKNRKIFKLKEVNSTNFYAGKLPEGTPDGSVIWAECQTQGRGQGENCWESAIGENLTFSIIVYPTFLKAVQQFYLSKIISLSVADFLSLYTTNVSIKWPNDIYLGEKKVAGILIENSLEMDFIRDSIIGIGININQNIFLSDAPNPVSLKQVTGENYDLKELLGIFLDIFEFRYGMLKDSDFSTIDENYSNILFRKGINAQFKSGNKTFTGIIDCVEKTGELVIIDNDNSGKIRKFLHKEVEFVLGG